MNKRFSRWLLILVTGLSIPLVAPNGAQAWLGGGYHRWYGWAGPAYGGFGGYPGARFVTGAGGYGMGYGYGYGTGVWGGDCWTGLGVGLNPVPSPADTKSTAPGNSVIMNVTVPPDAKLFVNGTGTTSVGSLRRFRSDDLQPGSYPYEVRAEVVRDGQKLVATKSVSLQTGEPAAVVFDFSPAALAALSMPTSLTLHVPAEAKVYLGDNATSSTGSVRRFATRMKAGQSFTDYQVRVELNVDGKLQTRQEVISLAAGETRELKFDFAAGNGPQMASTGSR